MKLSEKTTAELVTYAANGSRCLYGARLARAGKIIRERDGREAHAGFVEAANAEWSRLQTEFEKAFHALPQSAQRDAAIAWQERGEMPAAPAPLCVASIQGSDADRFNAAECGKPATHKTSLGNFLCTVHAKQKRFAKGNPQPIKTPAAPEAVKPENAFKVSGIPATVENRATGPDTMVCVVTVNGRSYEGKTLADAVKLAEAGLSGLRPVSFSFDNEGTVFQGFTDDSTWNGWLRVWVTPEVLAAIGEDDSELPRKGSLVELSGMTCTEAVKPCQCCGGDRDQGTSDAMQPGDTLCASCDAEARDKQPAPDAGITDREQSDTEPRIAWRYWSAAKPVFYVSQLPGQGGKDWGYTDKPQGVGPDKLDRAIPLSPYWQKRFAADCRRAGVEARFMKPATV